MRVTSEELATSANIKDLMDTAAQEFPRLGVHSCFLSLYKDPEAPVQQSRLVLAYGEKGRVELGASGLSFPSRALVPAEVFLQARGDQSDQLYSYLVEPLYFRENQMGFVLLDAWGQEGAVCSALCKETSSALRGALLLEERKRAEEKLEKAYAGVGEQVEERTAELKREVAERERLQQEVIEAQKQAIQELSTPVIPIVEGIIVMPLVGSIDTKRATDITRVLLAGIREHRAKAVILDITGVPIVDSGVASHLNKTIQAARLKGTQTIVTGVSEAVAETIVDLGLDWSGIETVADLRTGLRVALARMGRRIEG